MDDAKNVNRLLSAAQGGVDMPSGSMSPGRAAQITQVRDVLSNHAGKGSNPCV